MAAPRNPTYYDGDLPRALLDAAKRRITADGVDALTLRGLARDVGVSHAAPGHHFGSRAGLLTRLAVEGFEGLRATMLEEIGGVRDAAAASDRLEAAGRGYVRFCAREPALFAVLFRYDVLDWDDEDLGTSAAAAFGVLVEAVQQVAAEQGLAAATEDEAVIEAWALVHGLAVLWHHGPLPMHRAGTTLEELGTRITRAFALQLVR